MARCKWCLEPIRDVRPGDRRPDQVREGWDLDYAPDPFVVTHIYGNPKCDNGRWIPELGGIVWEDGTWAERAEDG